MEVKLNKLTYLKSKVWDHFGSTSEFSTNTMFISFPGVGRVDIFTSGALHEINIVFVENQ